MMKYLLVSSYQCFRGSYCSNLHVPSSLLNCYLTTWTLKMEADISSETQVKYVIINTVTCPRTLEFSSTLF